MGLSVSWSRSRYVGSATAFHGREMPEPARREVWSFEVIGPALALGSAQRAEVVDTDAAARAGVEVVRRRSGGGAVWLAPGEVTWVDVVLPAADPKWVDDVGRSSLWLGEAWVGALADVGVPGGEVHGGPVQRTPWSGLVCFAGLAPGEVLVGGRKVVGVAQRRSRAGARFQCAVLHRWEPGPLLEVLALDPGVRDQGRVDLAEVATGIGPVPTGDLVDALVARLPS